jgi:hypothetical protein
MNYYDQWMEVPGLNTYDNAFKIQWELFLRHVVNDEPFAWDLLEGAKGIQLADCAHESWQNRRWVDIPNLAC